MLDVKDGKALVISKYGLEWKAFDQSKRSIAWDISQARDWLNSDFIEISFNEKEQEIITTTKLSNHNNDKYGTKGGNNTEDNVFLLSIEEAEMYFSSDTERQCKPSDKIKEEVAKVFSNGNCCWWLRSPGENQKNVAYVNDSGEIDDAGLQKSFFWAFRPAMWISVSGEPQEPIVPEEISVGDIITFGTWQQKTNPNLGKDPIEWQVLDIQDGKALVLSKYILERKEVNGSSYNVTSWETSNFRKWLNNDFFNEAFSEEEKGMIIESQINNPANPETGEGEGKDTLDNVFLLSYEEVGKYLPDYNQRKAEYTQKTNGEQNLGGRDDYWCLRTKSYQSVMLVSNNDGTITDSFGGGIHYCGIRPAMWVDLSAFEELQEPVLSEEISVGDIITFGTWQQKINPHFGKTPIEWQVLDVKDGKALVISKYGLIKKPYNTVRTSVTWETCSLRKWLNNEFINEAFGAEEQKMIVTTKLSNPNNPQYGTNGGKDTEDKVFLLSIDEVNKYFSSAAERKCKPSAYLNGQGFYQWWLRSPGRSQNYAASVNHFGGVEVASDYVSRDDYTVRPAMWVDLSAFEE